MLVALTRAVSPSLARCELTHLAREPIDVARAGAQHAAYEAALGRLGCTLVRVPPEPDLPDAVFVEDAAVVLDELAVVTRPGAPSRRAETASVARALAPYRTLRSIEPPATLDGGDVLVAGRRVFVGRSRRSDAAGVTALRAHLEPLGYAVEAVALGDCLHLKSAACLVAPGTLLVNPAWVDRRAFGGLAAIEVDPAEPFAANALLAGGAVLHPAAFPRTRRRLEERGLAVEAVDVSEIAKAEGGVTCCSLLLRA